MLVYIYICLNLSLGETNIRFPKVLHNNRKLTCFGLYDENENQHAIKIYDTLKGTLA